MDDMSKESDEVERLHALTAAAVEKERIATQAAAREEKERLAADRAAKEAVEMANRDATHYNQTTVMLDQIMAAIGKKDPSPTDAIVVSYLMLYARDAMQQHTPQGGVNAIASFYRGKQAAKKAGEKA